jgi:starch synthase (maltosyl-transferring)
MANKNRGAVSQDVPPSRIIIENVQPMIDGGAFPIKRTEGEAVDISADIFLDGQDRLQAVVKWRRLGESFWFESPLVHVGNDRWEGRFVPDRTGRYEYTVESWADRFATWLDGLAKKADAGQSVESELAEGAALIDATAKRARGDDARILSSHATRIGSGDGPIATRLERALDMRLSESMSRSPDRTGSLEAQPHLPLWVERERARFGAWYELFPRSAGTIPGVHGTLRDLEAQLPYVASMGFDVLYLPPIHPIGRSHRKGPNNSLNCGPNDPGSPWAIGGPEGGHTAIHPALGTIQDFRRVVASANRLGIEVALDIAFQCSPDHPWVKDHPTWFRHRPDGTIQYAENPPKKYQDIYPLDFESTDWRALWEALRDVFLHWQREGVRIFRVDNPHTKAIRFWDWVIGEIHAVDPGVIFLSEAFTRPKVMKRLAKGGFTQSYSYFTWRTDKHGLTEYFAELTTSECAQYMRPNLFANTPDILHEFLQVGGRPAFVIRFVLAATLGASYGIYGPTYELCVGTPAKPGSEEYLDSEKYQLRHWNLDDPNSIKALIARVNAIRREHRALQFDRGLRFIDCTNERILAFIKRPPDGGHALAVIVSLDPFGTQSGMIRLPLEELGIPGGDHVSYTVDDLLNSESYIWTGRTNYVELDPDRTPAHILRLHSSVRTEQDFDTYR